MEAMKSDMLTLVNQLSDERKLNMHLSTTHNTRTLLPTPNNNNTAIVGNTTSGTTNHTIHSTKITELQKVLKAKESKLKQYHGIIITLKEEFIKLEAEKAEHELLYKNSTSNKHNTSTTNNNTANNDELRAMRDTVHSLKSKLQQYDSDHKKLHTTINNLKQDKIQADKQCEASEKEAAEALKKMDTAQQGECIVYICLVCSVYRVCMVCSGM
jgi:chromosome segregation ATPase